MSRSERISSSAARQRELRRTYAADEVATSNPTGVLQCLEDVVDGAESAVDAFGARDLSRQHSVSGEQLLRDCRGPLRW